MSTKSNSAPSTSNFFPPLFFIFLLFFFFNHIHKKLQIYLEGKKWNFSTSIMENKLDVGITISSSPFLQFWKRRKNEKKLKIYFFNIKTHVVIHVFDIKCTHFNNECKNNISLNFKWEIMYHYTQSLEDKMTTTLHYLRSIDITHAFFLYNPWTQKRNIYNQSYTKRNR